MIERVQLFGVLNCFHVGHSMRRKYDTVDTIFTACITGECFYYVGVVFIAQQIFDREATFAINFSN